MKNLNNVCLLTIDGVGNKTKQLDEVVDWCCSKFNFHSVVRITCDSERNKNQQYISIPKLDYFGYNRFCINDLYTATEHLNFTHCLLVQEDGFIVNPQLWEDSFLNFDYIGAPWLRYKHEPNFIWVENIGIKAAVGNGGFTLRSKTLLKECKTLQYQPGHPNEDVFICAFAGDYLRSRGMLFADINTAARFSLETKNYLNDDLTKCFGFHGKHLLDDALIMIRKPNEN